jgi:hypothetical protein
MTHPIERALANCHRADYDQGWWAALNMDIGGIEPAPWDPRVHGLERVTRRRQVMPPGWQQGFAGYVWQQVTRTDTVLWRSPSPAEVRLACQAAASRHLLLAHAGDDPELRSTAQKIADGMRAAMHGSGAPAPQETTP